MRQNNVQERAVRDAQQHAARICYKIGTAVERASRNAAQISKGVRTSSSALTNG